MIEVVIKYDAGKKEYMIYEPSTDTMMVSANVTEALVLLDRFLRESGLSGADLLSNPDVSYHIDSQTMKSMIEGNVKLLKRLNNAPSSFQVSSQKFGTSLAQAPQPRQQQPGRRRSSGGGFSAATGFRNAYKKFEGGKGF